jgi:NTE family protein
MRIHAIATDMAAELSASSKLIAEWDFLLMLRDEGRRRAQDFLDRKGDDLGRRSSFDLARLLDYV